MRQNKNLTTQKHLQITDIININNKLINKNNNRNNIDKK